MSGESNGRVGMRVQARPPGTEARAGKFPGPSLIPVLEVSCLGRCDIAPAVAVDERPAPVTDAGALVDAARAGEAPASVLGLERGG